MQRLQIALMAIVMGLASVLTVFAPLQAKADAAWQSTVVASSAVVRFEATPTGFDTASNKYKYQFSWLMPARRAYSFKIDGKMYMPKVYKNGVTETPFWFSPDVTYHIQIYSYINGRGNLLSDGTFTAPSVAVPTPALTEEQEFEVLGDYASAALDLPTKTVISKVDSDQVLNIFNLANVADKYADVYPYLSSKTIEAFSKTPLFVKDNDDMVSDYDDQSVKNVKVTIYSGNQYAKVRYSVKRISTGKYESSEMYFIKENGTWKADFIQLLKTLQ